MLKLCQIKNLSKPQEQLTPGRLTTNPFILIRSTSFGVLFGILQDNQRASSPGRHHPIPLGVYPPEPALT